MSTQVSAAVGNTRVTATDNAGEAALQSTVSPDDLPPEFIIETLLRIRSEEHAKAKAHYRTVKDIERAISRIVLDSGVKLPLHTEFGTVRKGYEADRYVNPKRFRLLRRRTLIGPKKRMVIKERAA